MAWTASTKRFRKEFEMLANPHFSSLHLAHAGLPVVLTVAAATALTLAAIAMPHPVIPNGVIQFATTAVSPCPRASAGYVPAANVLHGQSRPHVHTPTC
jgi:hypothetical protein